MLQILEEAGGEYRIAAIALAAYHQQVSASLVNASVANEFTAKRRCLALSEIIERSNFEMNTLEKRDIIANYLRLLSSLIEGFKKCQGTDIAQTSIFSKESSSFFKERTPKVKEILKGLHQQEIEKAHDKVDASVLINIPELKMIGEQILAFCNGL